MRIPLVIANGHGIETEVLILVANVHYSVSGYLLSRTCILVWFQVVQSENRQNHKLNVRVDKTSAKW